MKRKSTGAKPETPGRRRAKRPGRGTLMLVSGLLIGSALVRMGHDAGQAYAAQTTAKGTGHDVQKAAMQQDAAHTDPGSKTQMTPGQGAVCEPPPDVAALLQAFQTREMRLEKRESQLLARMQALSVADQEISRKMAALTTAEEALRATLALADQAAENDLARLTTVYESMKPKDAAALFEQMDPAFSAGFLGRMRPDAAAGIMTGLTPQTAYTISAILAGRNADVPTE